MNLIGFKPNRTFTRRSRSAFMMLAFFLLVLLPLTAQSFRGEIAGHHAIADDRTHRIDLRPGQVALLTVADDFLYLEGVAIRVIPPAEVTIPTGTFSLSIYEGVDPLLTDSSGFITITGRSVGTVPLRTEELYRLPFKTVYPPEHRTLKSDDPFRPADPAIGAAAIQIVPALKGMGSDLDDVVVTVEVVPILSTVGGLEIVLTGEDDVLAQSREILDITVNGTAVQEATRVFLTPGIYRLEVAAGVYLDHAENVGIDAARTTVRYLEVREPRAYLRIEVPSVAEVFLDGERILNAGRGMLEHRPGSYLLMIRLGDFVISRRVVLEANREYQIGLDLDILIKQN